MRASTRSHVTSPAHSAVERHIRQSRPESGLGFQVKVIKNFQVVHSSLGSGLPTERQKWYFIAEQPAPVPHLARPEGRAALTHMC